MSTRWTPFRSCRIRLDATSSSDSESRSKTCSQPAVFGSHHRRIVHFADASGARSAICRRAEAINSAAFSQGAHQAKVPAAVFIHMSPTAGSERTDERTDRAVVEMRRHNRTWGCKRIAQQIALAFGADIDKDVVRHSRNFRPERARRSVMAFPYWSRQRLAVSDLFRCESHYYVRTGFWW